MRENGNEEEKLPKIRTVIRMGEQREYIFVALFLSEFHEGEEKAEHVKRYFDGLHYTEEIRGRLFERYADILAKLGDIDALLEKVSVGWDLKRMGKAELNILRLATYEICYDEAVPERVAANEAVELAKKYGGNHSSGFVNGILSKVIKDSNGEEL